MDGRRPSVFPNDSQRELWTDQWISKAATWPRGALDRLPGGSCQTESVGSANLSSSQGSPIETAPATPAGLAAAATDRPVAVPLPDPPRGPPTEKPGPVPSGTFATVRSAWDRSVIGQAPMIRAGALRQRLPGVLPASSTTSFYLQKE